MAAPSLNSPRRARTPGRPRIYHNHDDFASEPPHKRRKYIPGGPGGGGRYIDNQGNEVITIGGLLENGEELEVDEEESEPPTIMRSAMQTRPRRDRPERYAPPVSTPRPRYSNSASAAAASQASDGYKPREERSWEDFHPDLDIDAPLLIFTADEVDGRTADNPIKAAIAQLSAQRDTEKAIVNGDVDIGDVDAEHGDGTALTLVTPFKRKPGRPPRRPESMLSGLGSPPAPRITPLPTHNPKERLNLPKPSFRHFSHFLKFEQDQKENKVNYVDRTMANVGFQESDRFELPVKSLIRLSEAQQIEDEADVSLRLESDGPATNPTLNAAAVSRVEYDMDEQDEGWLEVINEQRKTEGVDAIKPAIFEITMTQIEKEYHALEKRIPKPQPRHAQIHRPRSSSQAAVNGDPNPPGDEPDSKCSICDDGDCENANAIIFCDGCDLAVHQECYGVPFIPEGQWFCRKCKEIGRGTPTCIFCPNVDGAFKQTSTLRWSHLLCAIWIPEVTIANATYMEPITDVDKVPKGRWKLNCYICNQKMGACIQCSNKNCYLAFHVTCARRAKLFLKMKSQHQGGIDTTALKAFCDKHVSPEWRRSQDTDTAIIEAKRWYRHAMKDHKWADNQSAALELGAPPAADVGWPLDASTMAEDTITVANQKRKRTDKPKMLWRLPSGAPVVPAAVFNTVEISLQRFTIRKRKEFVEKACRYWTLKREARRGAALLKRLQLQLESFSSMELTRRNFSSMGSEGRKRLIRRIEFAEMLQKDMAYVAQLANMVKEREALRMREIELLRELVDTVYFPIPPLLWPILHRAQKLDEKTRVFTPELEIFAERLRERYYTSVTQFSRDLGLVFSSKLSARDAAQWTASTQPDDSHGLQKDGGPDLEMIHNQLNEVRPGTAEHLALTHEQKDLKRLAKRIVKAVKDLIEDAMRKEAELRDLGREEAMRRLDSLALFSSTDPTKTIEIEDGSRMRTGSDVSAAAGAIASPTLTRRRGDIDVDIAMADDDADAEGEEDDVDFAAAANAASNTQVTPASISDSNPSSGDIKPSRSELKSASKPAEPLSPPISTSSAHAGHHVPVISSSVDGAHDVFAHGGIAWYLQPFDPSGTTLHEERYEGRQVLKDMSEELSDMDEDTLTELAGTNTNAADAVGGSAKVNAVPEAKARDATAKKAASRKKKGKRSQWSR